MPDKITLKNQTKEDITLPVTSEDDHVVKKSGELDVELAELANPEVAKQIGAGRLALDKDAGKGDLGNGAQAVASTLLALVTPAVVGKHQRLVRAKEEKEKSVKVTEALAEAIKRDADTKEVAASATSVAEFAKAILTPAAPDAVADAKEAVDAAKKQVAAEANKAGFEDALEAWAAAKVRLDELEAQVAKVESAFAEGAGKSIESLEDAADALKKFKA